MKDKRAIEIIAKVAKRQLELKYGSVAEAITKLCTDKKTKRNENRP